MLLRKANELKEGVIAALDVYDLKGNILLKKGAELKAQALERLSKNNVPHIYTAEEPDAETHTVYELNMLAELLRVLYYFTSTGGENGEILKRYNQDEVRRFLSYSNEAGSRIAYGHIFKYFAGCMAAVFKSGKKQPYDFADYRDKSTYYSFHAVNSSCIAAAIGANMGFKESEIADLIIGTLLYDMKMFAYDFINDNRELKPVEKEEMHQHPLQSFEHVKSIFGISSSSASIALQHHERYNGSGYPKGLRKDDINILSRIAAVADVYDALTSSRPFRRAYPPEEAWGHIAGNSGVLFDPEVVDEFKRTIPKFMPGTTAEASGGRTALVCSNAYGMAEYPRIKLIEKNGKSAIISSGEKENVLIIRTII
jgi:HD-GYP domain-containing protein (c-di-GMP phosphodiesterase class II)